MKHSPAMADTLHRRAPMQGALAWLLMLAVLFGHGLGAVHSISHGAPGAGAHAQAGAPLGQHATGPTCDRTHGPGPSMQALFDHAPDEPGCRLYDQLLQAGPLMPVASVLVVPARTRTLPPPSTGVRLAAAAVVYQARGPPRA